MPFQGCVLVTCHGHDNLGMIDGLDRFQGFLVFDMLDQNLIASSFQFILDQAHVFQFPDLMLVDNEKIYLLHLFLHILLH